MPRVTFLTADGGRHEVEAASGTSLMLIAREHDLVEGTCDGSIACATCHMILDEADFARLEPASAEEEDMLDFASGLQPTSRLGCQVILSDALDGLTVHVPDAF